ncbi:MAG: hypothetical protein KJ724_12860, partial [Proteobacteria bacterium]|nr:hypothetical protein [Pseudomonadota bacterium]
MENRLILHVGLQKTGTTAIQSFLEINTNILKRQRVNYIINPTRLYMAWPIYRNREDATVPVEELWKPIKLSLQHSSVMYSNESFSNIVEERPEFVLDLTKLLPENPITIIVYIRRQDLHYESLYGQNIVHGEFRKFNPSPSDDYMIFDYGQTTKVYEYSRWLNIMSDHLRPQDKLVVRVYERGAFESGSIFNDFISAGGLQWDPEFTIPEKTVNVSLDGRFIELARKMASFYKINGPKNYNFHFESS